MAADRRTLGLGHGRGADGGLRAVASNAGARTRGFGRAKSVLLLYTSGGQSQLETWDPKPEAPDGIRGEFRPIATSVPGTLVGEHMPRLAVLADRYTIIRSLSHDDLDHGSATYLTLTGRFHPKKSSNPPPSPTDFPTLVRVLKRVHPNGRFPYDAIHVNAPAHVPQVIAPARTADSWAATTSRWCWGTSPAGRWPFRASIRSRSFLPIGSASGKGCAGNWTCRGGARRRPRIAGNEQLVPAGLRIAGQSPARQAFELSAEDPSCETDTAVTARGRPACWLGG